MRNRPAWLAADKPELLLQCQAIYFVDYAVNIKRQGVSKFAYILMIRYQFSSAFGNINFDCNRKTQIFKRL